MSLGNEKFEGERDREIEQITLLSSAAAGAALGAVLGLAVASPILGAVVGATVGVSLDKAFEGRSKSQK